MRPEIPRLALPPTCYLGVLTGCRSLARMPRGSSARDDDIRDAAESRAEAQRVIRSGNLESIWPRTSRAEMPAAICISPRSMINDVMPIPQAGRVDEASRGGEQQRDTIACQARK